MNDNNENKIPKPITIVREEFVGQLVEIINQVHLPAFIIEAVLKDLYLESKSMAKRQLEMDKEMYNHSLQSCEESR